MSRQLENFPEQVKAVRRQLDLSQEELAHALGVSFATVNRWENSKTVPSKLAQTQFTNYCAKMTKQGKLKHDKVLNTNPRGANLHPAAAQYEPRNSKRESRI
ncbi:MAG: helix-turn-helix domain-containing protein [Gammaproteobacteria bacterium]